MRRASRGVAAVVAVLLCASVAEAKKKSASKHKRRPAPPVPTLTAEGLPNVLAASAVVIDLETGEELFAKNAGAQRSIASISKLAAALAVRKVGLDLEAVTEITANDAEIARRGSTPHVKVGWKISNEDLLYATLIASENRAVPAIGRGAGLTPEELVKEMNGVAEDLGLKKTRFDETTGLSYNNKSTAREVAKLLEAAMKDELLADAMRSGTFELSVLEPEPTTVALRNTNRLTRTEGYTVLGGKTGMNNQARYCLATALEIEGRKVALVILGAPSSAARFGDAMRIAKWMTMPNDKVAAAPPAEAQPPAAEDLQAAVQ
jgi:serine-type D-Ala-D-Ala endopeptidase (penicillin-binding protein 7)